MKPQEILAQIEPLLPHVLEVRHELHRHPELSGQEHGTRGRILRELGALGIPVRCFEGCCSLMGTLENGEGPCIAIRADMDALPIREATRLPFASENPGVMHACGHDVHRALALGSAAWFAAHRDLWRGTVRWLFESEEETVGGGQRMVAQGCMRAPKVDCVIGQHMNPNYPMGTFYSCPGFNSGASDELRLTVRGSACHGAYPQRGADAIVAAAQVISALQTLVSRNLNPFEPAVVTFGTIDGGTANNIVCGEVRLTGTLRTLKPETRALLRERLRVCAEGVAAGLGCTAEMETLPSYGPVYNDPALYETVAGCARELLGADRMVLQPAPSLGVESFSYFLQETPGVYYDLGSGIGTALHTDTFCVDEAVIPLGIALQCAAVLRLQEQFQSGGSPV